VGAIRSSGTFVGHRWNMRGHQGKTWTKDGESSRGERRKGRERSGCLRILRRVAKLHGTTNNRAEIARLVGRGVTKEQNIIWTRKRGQRNYTRFGVKRGGDVGQKVNVGSSWGMESSLLHARMETKGGGKQPDVQNRVTE